MNANKHFSGFTLIEVMVSIGIFAIGFLGLMSIYGVSTYYSVTGLQFARASLLAQELANDLQHTYQDPVNANSSPIFSNNNTSNDTDLGAIDEYNAIPSNPAPEHSISDLASAGIQSCTTPPNIPCFPNVTSNIVIDNTTYERYWNVALYNGGPLIITAIVRWRSASGSKYHSVNVTTSIPK